MNPFQLVGTGFSAALVGALVWCVVSGKVRLRTALPWILIWSVASFCIAWPETTAILARRIGVQRGADLVSYVAILGTLVGFFVMSIRVRHLNRCITLLVRELALSEAERSGLPQGPPGRPSGPGA